MTSATLTARTGDLVRMFVHISHTRMQGVPVLNSVLQVEAVDFEACADAPEAHAEGMAPVVGALGVLITPWFMNLVWFSLARMDAPALMGCSRSRRVGAEHFDFIAGHEPAFGNFEACSLFSPMFEFADQATARATAEAVLNGLRRPAMAEATPPALPARRAFFLGRRQGVGA
jgi:[NiFe] hydrogenase assembly HybE family chaperone